MGSENFINKIKFSLGATMVLIAFGTSPLLYPLSSAEAQEQQQTPPRAMDTASDTAAIYNNLANTYLEQLQVEQLDTTKLDTAILFYKKAMELDPKDGGIKLNLGIAYLIKGDTTAADSFFSLGLAACDSNLSKAYSLLKIEIKPGEKAKEVPEDITEDRLRGHLQEAADKLSSKKKKSEKKGKEDEEKRKKKAPPAAPRTWAGGPKFLDPQKAKKYLYWKQ